MLDPWSYAEKYPTEHGEQVALFMWANMAANFGLTAANDKESYTIKGSALANLDRYDDKISELAYLFAIPNQGHGDKIRGSRQKSEGLKTGAPDICLPVSSMLTTLKGYPTVYNAFIKCGLYIELKRKQTRKIGVRKTTIVDKAAGKASVNQERWQAFLRKQGYVCEICHGWENAVNLIIKYLTEGNIL
jgi:hypothetical protein